jgi:hypothetical protein
MSSPGANGNGLSLIQTKRTESNVLLRRLTTHSSQGLGTELVLSNLNLKDNKDVEKGPFNLQDCFTLFNEANKFVGTQRKHVGVTWEYLQVVVSRDKDYKVKAFSRDLDSPSYFFK